MVTSSIVGAQEWPGKQSSRGWMLSRAALLCLAYRLMVGAEGRWTIVYNDTFTREETMDPSGLIDATLAGLVCGEDGALAEACPASSPCRRERCVLNCCDDRLDICSAPLSQPCVGSGESWPDRWSVDYSEPAAAQLCGDVYVAGGYNNVGRYQVLSGYYPLPQLPGESGLQTGHQEVQVSLQLFAIDSWDGEAIVVKADGIVVWNGVHNFNGNGEMLCGAPYFSDTRFWVNFTLRHSADALRLAVSNTLNQPPDDESIGIGQVIVAVNTGASLPSARGVRAETWITSEEYSSFPSDVAEVPWISSKGSILLRAPEFSDRVEMLDTFLGLISAQERRDEWLILLLRVSTCVLVETAGTYRIRMVGAGTALLHIDGEPVSEEAAVTLKEGYRLITAEVVARDRLVLEWRHAGDETQAWSPVDADLLYLDSVDHRDGRCPNLANHSVTSPILGVLATPGCSGWSFAANGTDIVTCAEISETCTALADPSQYILHVGPAPAGSFTVVVDYQVSNRTIAYCSDIPVNEQQTHWADTFSVHVDTVNQSVTVTRTDRSSGWGQDLQLACTVSGPSAAVLARRDVLIPGTGSVWLGFQAADNRPLPDTWVDGEPAAGSECPEVGQIDIIGNERVSISLRQAFSCPLVFASAAVNTDPAIEDSSCDVAVVRVSNMREVEGRWVFDLIMAQPSCGIGRGAEMCRWTVSWLALDEKEGVAGQVASTGAYVDVKATITASTSPILVATIQQYSDSDRTTLDDALWLVSRSDGLVVQATDGYSPAERLVSFRLGYQRDEGIHNPIASSANIAWLLILAGEGSFGCCGVGYEAGSLSNVGHDPIRLAFTDPFLPSGQSTYSLLSHIATANGPDPVTSVRLDDSMFISEEQCGDAEQSHYPETIHWIRIWRHPLNLSAGSHVIEVSQPAGQCLPAVGVDFAEPGDCQLIPALTLGMRHGTCHSVLRNGEQCQLGCSSGWNGSGSLISCDSGALSGLDTQACTAEAVDCQGRWSECDNLCRKVFSVAVPSTPGGAECAAQDGATADCEPGEGLCPATHCIGVPRARIIGPSEITTSVSRPLTVRAAAELPECVTDPSQLSVVFTWSIYNTTTEMFNAISVGPTAVLPPFTFSPGETARIRVSISSSNATTGDRSSADAVIVCQRSPLLASIGGGTMRRVGRTATFVLDGSSSHDPDDLMELPSDAYSWSCAELERRNGSEWQATHLACPVAPPSASTWSISAANLSAESRYRFSLTISRDERSASADTIIEISPGSPPDVSISGGTGKANPASKLVLYGNAIPSFAQDIVTLAWSARVGNSFAAEDNIFDLTQPGVLSTTVDGANLVVRPNQLESGKHYTFVLTATGRDGIGYSQISVSINDRPCCGSIRALPEQGFAVIDSFSITAEGWQDDDRPLSYLFGTALSAEGSLVQPLTDVSSESSTSVVLPEGRADNEFRRYIVLEVRDAFDAAESGRVAVRVNPFVPPVNVSIQETASSLLKTSLAVQDASAVGQIVLGMCEALNDDASDNSDAMGDAARARDVLLDALISTTGTESAAILTESTVSRNTAIIQSVTASPRQLSSHATDKSLAFTRRLSSSDKLSSDAIGSIAATVSNLLHASTQQYVDNHRRLLDEDNASVSTRVDAAYNRSSALTDIVNDCATVIAHRHVIGEVEEAIETDAFELRVSTNTVVGWENSQVGNGLVAVPPNAFAGYENSTEPIASKIITYASIGPLFYAPLAPTNNSVRGTDLVTVTFAREGEDLEINNLSQPFIVQLSVDPSANREHAETLCGHFDPATQDWVVDGKLEGRTVDQTRIVCSYTHLTDFVAFLGPEISANEVSILKIFSAEWLANPAGAIISLTVLGISIMSCCYSMRQYKRLMKQIKDPVHMSHFHRRTDAFAEKRLKADAQHVPLLHRWAVRLQQQYQLGAMCCGHAGDPYAPSQRFMVFMMAMLVSLFINILFFESEQPVCTSRTVCNATCYGDVCQNDTCVETNELECVEDDLGNGFLASVISALVGLPVVGSLHIAFSWMRKPLEQELAHKVLLHEKKAGTLVIRSASNLAAGDWALGHTSATSDPYAIVYWNDKKIGRTKVVASTVSPRWDAAFNLSTLVGPIDSESENNLRVELWEWDQLSGDDFLGAVHLAGQGCSFLPRIERTYSLECHRGENSSLVQGNMSLQFLEEPPSSPGLVDTRRWGGPEVHYGDRAELPRKRCRCCCRNDRYAKTNSKVQPANVTQSSKAFLNQKGMETTQFLAPDSTVLPPGWETKTSRKSGKRYYYNRETGTSTFDIPRVDDKTHNDDRMTTLQILPSSSSRSSTPAIPIDNSPAADGGVDRSTAPLPHGWVTRKSRSTGKIYFYNATSNTSVWEHPGKGIGFENGKTRRDHPQELTSALPDTTPAKDGLSVSISVENSKSSSPQQEVGRRPLVQRLPPMTGLTSTLLASKRRIEQNTAKVAADKAVLDKMAVQRTSGSEITSHKNPRLSSFLKRGAEEQRLVELRRMHHASVAYCYGLSIGVLCSLFIAATAVNFGPDKTLEWLGVTSLSLIWRMFVIEPIKVLLCGGFEGVAGLITGEADDWTEGFADAFADAAEGGIEDAGLAGAGLAAMDNVSRQREKRDAAVKLAAVAAFQSHVHHAVPSPKTPGARSPSLKRGV